MIKFETFLEEKFMDLREIGGMPITKDNCEDLFSSWLENLDVQEYIDYADEAIRKAVRLAKDEMADLMKIDEALRLDIQSKIFEAIK
jgi:hypothetical protein